MRVPFKKSTVHDVAVRAGVSQSAVSHYINGRVSVCSAETAERIDRAIEELHFTPARALRHQGRHATNTIGVCVSLPAEDEVMSSYTYLHRFWSGVSSVLDEQSYRLMHFPRSMRNSSSCNPFLDGGIDGLLISAKINDERLHVLADAGLPTVAVNRCRDIPKGCGVVGVREEDIVDLAMSHLWELGHRRIAYFGASVGQGFHVGPRIQEIAEPSIRRHDQWRVWASKADLDLDAYAAFTTAFDYVRLEHVLLAVDRWLALPEPPTAVFCGNDRLAISLAAGLRERGLRVPEDMSIVGADNEGACLTNDPQLTSVEAPIFEVGKQATQMLIDMVKTGSPAIVIELPVNKLIVRSSTCPAVL